MSDHAPLFNADAWLAGCERPEVRIDNVTYRGRLLSIEEWLPFEGALERIMAADADASAELLDFAGRYLRAVFPRAAIPWPIRAMGRDPVPRLLRLPMGALVEMLRTFLQAQHAAMGMRPTPSSVPGLNLNA